MTYRDRLVQLRAMALAFLVEIVEGKNRKTTEDLSKNGPDRYTDLITEVALLSGRVELTMRLLSRIIGKMDPSFLNDPHDPVVQHRSQLIGNEVLAKLKAEALAQAAHDPDAFARLQRYFKDL